MREKERMEQENGAGNGRPDPEEWYRPTLGSTLIARVSFDGGPPPREKREVGIIIGRRW